MDRCAVYILTALLLCCNRVAPEPEEPLNDGGARADDTAGGEADIPADTADDTETGAAGDGDTDGVGDTESAPEDCVPHSYQQCGDDGRIKWFDSCGNEEETALEQPDGNFICIDIDDESAEYVCEEPWQGDRCDQCPEGWDPEEDCTACLPEYADDGCQRVCRFYVAQDAPEDGDGSSWLLAFSSVQQGIDAAFEDLGTEFERCHVWVSAGVYDLSTVEDGRGLELRDRVSLFGGFRGDEHVLDERDLASQETVLFGGEESVTSVVTAGGACLLDGFTIKAGRCSYPNIYAPFPGLPGSVNGCSPDHNISPPDMTSECRGGGLKSIDAEPTIRNCRFVENNVELGGGAYVSGGEAVFINTVFFENMSRLGAAFFAENADVMIINSTVVNNQALTHGPIEARDSRIALINTIVWNNFRHICSCDPLQWGSICNVEKEPSVLWRSSSVVGVSHSALQMNLDQYELAVNENNVEFPPAFMAWDEGNLALAPSSPCVDSADATFAPETDLLGNTRFDMAEAPNTGRGDPPYTDMGAIESFQ